MSNTDAEYWASYTALQAAKHDLLRRYLGGWFPILSTFNGRVIYVDCHAGKGRHQQGEAGSPIIALTVLKDHRVRDAILARCEVKFIFLEHNSAHLNHLQSEINALGALPKQISTEVVAEDYESVLTRVLDNLDQSKGHMAPSFFFVDPYGFTLNMALMRRLLSHNGSELLINFMVRYIDMAITLPAQDKNMDLLFGTEEWRKLRQIGDPKTRRDEMIRIYTQSLGCAHSSVLQMLGAHKELKYSLIHVTNNEKGRELMKTAMWKVTDGSFTIYQSDDPKQQILITPDIDLSPLKKKLLQSYKGKSVKYEDLKRWLLPQNWDYPHLHAALRELKKEKQVEFSGFEGKFGFNKNPMIKFPT